MSSEVVKMSKIMQHNPYQQTDSLYNPLRKVINKSAVPPYFQSKQSSRSSLTPQKLQNSHLTHDIKMLSTSEAQRIRKNTFIADKELIPTNHIEKVAGKHFYAVDVEQKYGEPLTSSQFDRFPKQQTVNQIVYQYKDAQGNPIFPSYRGTLYQSYAINKPQEHFNHNGYIANPGNSYLQVPGHKVMSSNYGQKEGKTTYRPFSQLEQRSITENRVNRQAPYTEQKVNSNHPYIYQRTENEVPISHTSYFNQEKTFVTTQPSDMLPAFKVNGSPTVNQGQYYSEMLPSKHQNTGSTLQRPQRPTLIDIKTNQFSSQTIRKKVRRNNNQSHNSHSSIQISGVKQYKFDKTMTSARSVNRTELQSRKRGGDYKYNLFSILDKTGNQGCSSSSRTGCLMGNQLVAARRTRTQWNQ